MTPVSLAWSFLEVGGILALAAIAGRAVIPAFVPPGDGFRLERWGWSIAFALFLLASTVVVAFTVGTPPGWLVFAVLSGGAIALARRFRLPGGEGPAASQSIPPRPIAFALLAVTVAGVAIYAARSLAEPMWSNDYLAVWGLKGKTIFAAAGIPQRLFRWPEFEFSNQGYPLGLPLVYAGIAFLLDRWDDHAMALVFPFFQLATLLVLVGWLRRRGSAAEVALAAAAFVANFGSLYSAWLTGMAEVPAAFSFLLLGTALCDVLDGADAGSVRRLFLGSLLAAATKNEGVFLVATAVSILVVLAARRKARRLWSGAAAAVAAGLGSVLLHRGVLGGHSVHYLDLGLLRSPGLGSRVAETLREEWIQLVRPVWPGLLALGVLVALCLRRSGPNPIFILVAASVATYLALPALCLFGPAWLVHWTVGRITCTLVPLLAAGIGMAWRGPATLRSPAMSASFAP